MQYIIMAKKCSNCGNEVIECINCGRAIVALQCELWENHAGAHFFNNFNISDDEC